MPKPQAQPIDESKLPELAQALMKEAKFPLLASIDENQARLRPVSPVKTDGFTVYVANLKSYGKTKEIAANPRVELCYVNANHDQVRITGIAEVLNDRPMLEEIWRKNRLLEHYLGSIDNPELIVYIIKPTRVRYMKEWALDYYEVPF